MMEELEESKESLRERRLSIAVTVVLVVCVLFCLYVVIQVLSNGYVSIGGFMLFRVVTGSMEPTIPVGALMVTRQVDIETIRIDDIVCFRTQVSEIWGKIVTHRVVGTVTGADGTLLLETKGDANLVMDGYYVTRENLIGKVIWHTADDSTLAAVLAFLTSKIGFLGCIVFPCLMFVGLILRESVSNIRKELTDYVEEMNRMQRDMDCKQMCADSLTQEEYAQMVRRVRMELMEELKQRGEISEEEQEKTE